MTFRLWRCFFSFFFLFPISLSSFSFLSLSPLSHSQSLTCSLSLALSHFLSLSPKILQCLRSGIAGLRKFCYPGGGLRWPWPPPPTTHIPSWWVGFKVAAVSCYRIYSSAVGDNSSTHRPDVTDQLSQK